MPQKTIEKLQVQYLPVEEIKKYDANTKLHSPKQIAQIKKSVEEFGFVNPILIDENNEIIAGHGRLDAAKQAKMTEIPAIRLEHLSEAEKKAYRIADNKLTELGTWDIDKLEIEFKEIEAMDTNFSLDITGFEMPQIEGIIEGISKEADPVVNAIPFIPEDEIVSKEGDIWQLGRHYIICGDSLKKETFTTLMGDKKAQMVFCDMPYNLPSKEIGGKGKFKHKNFRFAYGEMTSQEFQEFIKQSFLLLKEFGVDGSLSYQFMDFRHIREISCAGAEVYDELKSICVWNKTSAGMGSFYRSKFELVLIFKNGKAPHINNIELGKNGRNRSNVWDYAGVNSFGKERANLQMHNTCKPCELVKDAILDASNRGGIILDAFLGSGTTLIASEKANRICYGIEIEPVYIDTTIRRYEKLTGKEAVHLKSGKTYKELLAAKKEGK